MAVTPLTGKTHVRYCRFLLNGANLSGDIRTVNAFGVQYDQADGTGWSDGSRQWLAGYGTVMLDGLTALFNNKTAATGPVNPGAHIALKDLGSAYASVFIGIRAAPAIGNPTYSAAFEQGGYSTAGGGSDALMVEGSFFGSGVLPLSTSVWGVCLANGTELTTTTNNGSVDNGAATSNGYIAFLHLEQTSTAMASNSWSFKIEHSTNDSSWATLATFTLNGATATVERLTATGTVNRYVRLVSTRAGGAARPWASFIRL